MWGHPGPKNDDSTKAWCHNKSGVVKASIEGKDLNTQRIITLAECDGCDFVNFEWMVNSSLPGMLAPGFGSLKPRSRIVGLTLVTREWRINIVDTGEFNRSDRTPEEKRMNLATFGR
jgi:hypothetical protein